MTETTKPVCSRVRSCASSSSSTAIRSVPVTSIKFALPSRDAGPPVAKLWGRRPLYDLNAALAWAEARCAEPDTAVPHRRRITQLAALRRHRAELFIDQETANALQHPRA